MIFYWRRLLLIPVTNVGSNWWRTLFPHITNVEDSALWCSWNRKSEGNLGLGRSGLLGWPKNGALPIKEAGKKILFASLNFGLNPFFLPKPQNWLFRLLELPKPFARPPLSGFRVTWQRFSFFLLYLFWLNLWKIILNYKKNHKIENPILLDSTWVDLCIEHIIWYTLV